jgi:protein CpxP
VLLRQASTQAIFKKRQDAFGYRGAEVTSRATLPSVCMKFLAENLAIENHSNRPTKNQHKRVLVVTGGLLSMRSFFTVGLTGILALGMIVGIAMGQENASQPQGGNQGIHAARAIDQELDHLTRDLELTPNQRKQIGPLLEEHRDRIQALFDKDPGVSRKGLGPQIHAISDENHHQMEALLTEHQKQLARAMQEGMRDGEESRRPAPSTASR